MSDEKPERKHPTRKPVYRAGNRPVILFTTVCTKDRKPILAREECVEIILQAWRESNAWLVGGYVILPDHLHMFCAPGDWPSSSIHDWVKYWKRIVTTRWPHPEECPIWQRDMWDTQLRKGESYSSKWEYVRMNPVRHGLVANPDEWPFQGQLTELQWLMD